MKTPELRKETIVGAMYGTFDKNESNAFRENKTISNVKFDTKKGLYTVAA